MSSKGGGGGGRPGAWLDQTRTRWTSIEVSSSGKALGVIYVLLHGLRPGAFPSLGLPQLCLAKLVWQVLFLPEQHPQIQAWFLLGVLTGATAPSLQRQTPLQGQEVEGKGGHACFLELEGALVNLTCACQITSVISDCFRGYGL